MTQQTSMVAASRQAAIAEMIAQVRAMAQSKGISRETLEDIKAEMVQVAKRRELFPLTDFQPEGEEPGRRPMQAMHKDADGQFALYMSTSVSEQKPPPQSPHWNGNRVPPGGARKCDCEARLPLSS